MNDDGNNLALVPKQDYDGQLQAFEEGLLRVIDEHGLPSDNILVPVSERGIIFRNLEHVLDNLPLPQRERATYVSKFIAAAAAGLFDAALNYLWDETIAELRRRVAIYDLSYFFDIAAPDPDRRKRLVTEEDLARIDDSELIRAANKIGLVSDLGFKHLDYIRYMRNWASAAHPNQHQITGMQVLSWLETCLREVIALPIPTATVEIGKLLSNIKSNRIDSAEAQKIGTFFADLPQERADPLAAGFFAIYCQPDTASHVRDNVRLLLPRIWPLTSEEQRERFGVKYSQYVANSDQLQAQNARDALDLVQGAPYIPEGLRAAEIETAVQNLLGVHREYNNFYNEPAFARQLQRLVGEVGKIPVQVESRYVLALVEVFLTNGNGTAWHAETIYADLITRFTREQALIALKSFLQPDIASRLQFDLCQKKFRKLIELVEPKITSPAILELVKAIKEFTGPFDKLRDDANVRRVLTTLAKITGRGPAVVATKV